MADHEKASDLPRPAAKFAEYHPRASDVAYAPIADLIIAPAMAGDLDGIANITFEREGGTREQAIDRARRMLAAPAETNVVLVARIQSEVIAYGRIGFIRKPAEAEYSDVPEGWYLTGVVVGAAHRRRGIALELTRQRVEWISQRANEAFYFANSRNRATIDLHQKFGFQQVRSDFRFPGVTFSQGGIGLLFRVGFDHGR
jgi:ribosomal protein S18 acetylase RimI-like enzyme